MAYAVEPGESSGTAFDRILREELDTVLAELKKVRAGCPGGVHDYRRHLKKARSLVRMARYAFRDREMRDIARTLAGATRVFAPWREREALEECLRRLSVDGKEPSVRELWERALAGLQDALGGELGDAARNRAVREAKALLKDVRSAAENRSREVLPVAVLCRGVRRSYAEARRSMAAAREHGQPEPLHEWRKCAKHVRHQVQVISPAWPACLAATESELHRLTDALGEVHDLALLRAHLSGGSSARFEASEIAEMGAAILRRTKGETERAFQLGALLFAEDSRAFHRRIRGYVKLWESGTDPGCDA